MPPTRGHDLKLLNAFTANERAIVGLLVVYVIFKEILVIRFWLLATAFLLVVTFVIFGFSYLNVDRRRADRAEQILRFTE